MSKTKKPKCATSDKEMKDILAPENRAEFMKEMREFLAAADKCVALNDAFLAGKIDGVTYMTERLKASATLQACGEESKSKKPK
jgi:hypothetical protein